MSSKSLTQLAEPMLSQNGVPFNLVGNSPFLFLNFTLNSQRDRFRINALFSVLHRKDVLSQFSMVNLELFNIFEDIKKVSKAFVVNPKLVNAQNASSMSF